MMLFSARGATLPSRSLAMTVFVVPKSMAYLTGMAAAFPGLPCRFPVCQMGSCLTATSSSVTREVLSASKRYHLFWKRTQMKRFAPYLAALCLAAAVPVAAEDRPAIDVVFCIDCSGSMGPV